MGSRIEIGEVVSFRLRVPEGALERLVSALKSELSLEVARQGEELMVSQADGDSFLRFRPVDANMVLTEVALCNDERGLFFQRVLGALMVEHRGDLHVRLVWNVAERNTQGEFAEVSIRRGATSYPGLQPAARALRNTLVAASPQGASSHPWGEEPNSPPPEFQELSTEEHEIEQLLARGKAEWEEYQRLKGGKADR
jgi:hypothetical protein